MQDSLRVKLLGQNAQIGNLYDIRKNSVIKLSILNTNPMSNGLVKKIDLNQTNYHFTLNDSYYDKFRHLKVNADLKLEILMGLYKADCFSSYLNELKQSARSKKYTFLLEIKKAVEFLNINEKKIINFDALANKEATHVIVGIHWGANVVASFELDESDHKQIEEKEGIIGGILEKLKDLFESNQVLDKYKHENLKLHTDIVPDTGLPKNGQDTLKFLENFPKFVNQTNNGKGIPLEIELLSINSIIELFKIQHLSKRVIKQIDQSLVQQIEEEFNNLVLKKQELNDLIKDCERNNECLHSKHIKYLKNLKQKIDENEAGFKDRVSRVLYEVKSGEKEQNVLSNYFSDFLNSQYSSNGISLILSQNESKTIEKKVQFIQQLQSLNLKMIKKSQKDLNFFVNSNSNIQKEIYIFKADLNVNVDNSELNGKYWNYFLSLKRKKTQALFFIYDFEIFEDTDKELRILYFVKGNLIDSNCFKENKPFARPIKQVNLKLNESAKPEHSKPLKSVCSNLRECPRSLLEWYCEKCEQKIYYDKKLIFYCKCGSFFYENYEYKCTSPHHPEYEFFKFDNIIDLKQYLLKFF